MSLRSSTGPGWYFCSLNITGWYFCSVWGAGTGRSYGVGLTGLLGDLMCMFCLGWSPGCSNGGLCLYGSESGSGLDLSRSEAGDLS